MDRREHLFIFILLKSQIFISSKLEEMWGNKIRFNKFFTITPKIPYKFNFLFLNRGRMVILS